MHDGRYSLTIWTDQHQPRFTAAALVNEVLHRFRQCSRHDGMAITAYCFMPDRVHLLVTASHPEASVERFLMRAKQSSGYWFSTTYGGRLWERDAEERALRSDEDTWEVIRHLLATPVGAGLARHPLDYPFSGSDVCTRDELAGAFGLVRAG